VRLEKAEQMGQLLVAYADEYQEVKEAHCGNIVAVTGLKVFITSNLFVIN